MTAPTCPACSLTAAPPRPGVGEHGPQHGHGLQGERLELHAEGLHEGFDEVLFRLSPGRRRDSGGLREQFLLRSEVVDDQARIGSGRRGDGPDGRALIPRSGELAAGGGQDAGLGRPALLRALGQLWLISHRLIVRAWHDGQSRYTLVYATCV
jgi:hypothetical protein